MLEAFLVQTNKEFLIKLLISFITGALIGFERELRGKPAGIGMHCMVVAGSMIFTFISYLADPNVPIIAAQIITGIGFLGAGIIIKGESGHVTNLTTAASVWYSAAIGMAIGFGLYFIAIVAAIFATVIPRIPSVKTSKKA